MIDKEEGQLKEEGSKKHSIKSWLLLPYLSILLIASIVMGGFLLYGSIKNSKLVLNELEAHMVEHVNQEILQSLSIADQLNQINKDMFQAGSLKVDSQKEREVYFSNILKSYPRAAMTFIGLKDGSFYGARRNLDGKNFIVRNDESTNGGSYYYSTDEFGAGKKLQEKHENFDPRTRPWYRLAEETGQPSYSPVYMHFVFQEPTVTASSPVYDDEGELIGVFGVNYLLSWMDELVKSLLVGENGIIYIVDQEDNLISTSMDIDKYSLVDDELKLTNINKIDNEYINKSKDAYKKESEKTPTIKVKGEKYYVNKVDINHKNIKWQAYFLIAENDFLGNIKVTSIYTILFLIIFVVISIRITFLIAEKIGGPIEELSRAAEKLSSGSFEYIVKERKIKEIDSLTDSLNKSGKTLAILVADLEEQVLDRTKELENKNKILKNLSYYDGLTGIYNRRKFDETYPKLWSTAVRLKNSLGIIMIDIDDFKKYNDRYGHIKGDKCLREIAQELGKGLRRSTDLLARYGGEEFIAIIEGAEEEDLKILSERLRKAVEDLKIEHESAKTKWVTISLGYSQVLPTIEMDKKELVDRADKALYKAKLAGKNQAYKG